MIDENQTEPTTVDETQPTNVPALPKRRGRPPKRRENVIDTQGWGSTSRVIAPEPEPNPIVLPAPDQAVKALAELADLNDAALKAYDRWQDAQKRAKSLKGEWETLVADLQRKLKSATHKADTPLFDAAEAESDLRKMETAAQAPAESSENGPATVLAFGRTANEAEPRPEVAEDVTNAPEAPVGAPAEIF